MIMVKFENMASAFFGVIQRVATGSFAGDSPRSMMGLLGISELWRGSQSHSMFQSLLVSVLCGPVVGGCAADEQNCYVFDSKGLVYSTPREVLLGGGEAVGDGYLVMANLIGEGDVVFLCNGGDLDSGECLIGVEKGGDEWQWKASEEDSGDPEYRCVVYFAESLMAAGVKIPVYRVRPMFTVVGLRCYYGDAFEAMVYDSIGDSLIKPSEHDIDVSGFLLNLLESAPPKRH